MASRKETAEVNARVQTLAFPCPSPLASGYCSVLGLPHQADNTPMRVCIFLVISVAPDRQKIAMRMKVECQLLQCKKDCLVFTCGSPPEAGVPASAAWGTSMATKGILFALQSMVGSDIAELLMQDCKKLEKYKRQPPVANLINLTDGDWPVLSSGTRDLLTGEIPPSVETPAQIVEKFTKLLYHGRKKASAAPTPT